MFNFLSADVRRDPFGMYETMRSSSPLLHEPQTDAWLVFDYETAKWALDDHDTFSSRAAPPGGQPLDWMIFFDPPHHTKLRGIISRAFTPRVIAALEPRIRELSRELLDRTIDKGEMDLAAEFSIPLPVTVIAQMLGIPLEDWEQFKRWSDAILMLSDTIGGGDAAQRAARDMGVAKLEMKAYLTDLLAERRKEPRGDLLSRLLHAEVDGQRLTFEEILGFFQLLLLAGNETTTNLINNAVLCFIDHPEQLERVRNAPALLPSAIEEVLRYRSPLQVVFRTTTREVQIHGQAVPAGKLVLLVLGSANRDRAQFADADRFDVARDPNPHLAFGRGIHFCLGAPLSRLEARIALTALLSRIETFELAVHGPWEPRLAFHVHGPSKLPIRFQPNRAVAAGV